MKIMPSFLVLFMILIFSDLSAQKLNNFQSQNLLNLSREHDLSDEDIEDALLSSNHVSSISGVHHYYYHQRHDGIEINQANASVHLLPSGQVLKTTSSFIKNPVEKINGPASPTLTAQQAIASAASQLNYTFTEPLVLLEEETTATDRAVLFSTGGISRVNIPVHLMYQPVDENTIRLAWDLSIHQLDGANWWSLRIDATTGAILHKNNWVVSCSFDHSHNTDCSTSTPKSHCEEEKNDNFSSVAMVGSYNVYPMPVESPNHGVRSIVSNPDNALASPFGWHDTNGAVGAEFTITRGNNAHAYEDGDNIGYSPDGGASLTFNHPINTNYSAGDQSEDAAITNLFYWSNITHDLWYQYGYDEASGNFQENNYGNGGVGSDYVQAEAQDGSGTCNANFGTPPDGSNPTMQMFICNSRDGDLDNGVVVHEYGHGISNRLTGGGNNTGCLSNTEQMGEGWSDWFGMMMTIEAGDAGADSRGMGTWLFGQGAGGAGIRPFPYSTSMTTNPQTYNSINGVSVPHGVGSVWCTMLWEMAWALIDLHGFDTDFYNGTGGNNMAMALVTEGMKLQPCSPGFVDGRDAILAADAALYAGANECLIWEAFAKRGLGFGADQGSSGSVSDGMESFDPPLSCQFPAVAFEKANINTFEGDGPETPASTGECRSYTDHDIKVILNKDPSASVDVSITVTGTADTEDYDLFNSDMTFVTADEQTAILRIYNDATVETNETLKLDLVINNPGATDADLGNIKTLDVLIATDDYAPGAPTPFVLNNSTYETDTDGYTSTNPGGGAAWARGTAQDATSSAWTVPAPLDGSTFLFYANDDACNCNMNDVTMTSPIFNLSNITSTELKYDIFYEARTYQDIPESAELLISTDGGGSFTSLGIIPGQTGTWREETVDLSAYDGMNNIVIAFHYSDGGGWLYGITVDHVRINGLLGFEPAIAIDLNQVDEQDVPPNSEVFFYDANDKLIASINNGATDLGCVEVTIDREGTGTTAFWDNLPEHNLTNKTYFFNPEFDSTSISYAVTLYYTEAEALAWENETGNVWAAQAKVVKHPTAISDVTPANPQPNGTGSIEQNVDMAGLSAFSGAYYVTATFNTGFSGMAVGDPGTNPLPVELIEFSGKHVNRLGNQLQWSTASETNNDYFSIEHSLDGKNFEAIGEVRGKGTSALVNSYQFLDKTLRTGSHYYRLRQVDFDGTFEYSDVIVIKITSTGNMQVFPNPATNDITVSLADGMKEPKDLILYNATGQKVLQQQVVLQEELSFSIDISNLAKGVYYGELSGQLGEEPQRFRFIKE